MNRFADYQWQTEPSVWAAVTPSGFVYMSSELAAEWVDKGRVVRLVDKEDVMVLAASLFEPAA